MRPSDPLEIKGQPTKASKYLSWDPKIKGSELVVMLVESQIKKSCLYEEK
jgi:GDP-D-mannose dehydratase